MFHMTTNMFHMTTAHQVSATLAQVVGETYKSAGLSQRGLAEAAGIPLVTLSRKLLGQSPFTAIELVSVSRALGVSFAELALRAEQRAGETEVRIAARKASA